MIRQSDYDKIKTIVSSMSMNINSINNLEKQLGIRNYELGIVVFCPFYFSFDIIRIISPRPGYRPGTSFISGMFAALIRDS